jgi:hypothetical protein
MTFDQWFDSLEGCYEGYEELLREAWEMGAEEASKKKLGE